MQHGQGEFDHCNNSNVTPIWVEFNHSRIGAILFLLGLCSQPITWWLACQIIWGRKVLEVAMVVWLLATAIVPVVAGFMPALLLSRGLVGIGEGVSPSAATDLIVWSISLEEHSRAVAIVFGGLSIGSVLGLLLAPSIIHNFGWESVFFAFGLVGIIWCLIFELVKEDQSMVNIEELFKINGDVSLEGSSDTSLKEMGNSLKEVPWKAFFKSEAVWAMIYAHFCGS
ncbi:putative anion transporter 5, chloroplastic [Carex rostrata]